MILSESMVEKLHEIRRIESSKMSNVLDVASNELGNCLIDVYYSTSNLETRELITEFMNEAGVNWLRKLLTKDTSPVEATKSSFATVNDYMSLMPANDNVVSISAR